MNKDTDNIKAVYVGNLNLSEYVTKRLGVDETFLMSLQNEDDWGFVIKVSALLESLVTDIILNNIQNDLIHSHINKLGMMGATGKLKLGKEMGVLNKRLRIFCEAFLPIRNKFVHGTKYLHTSLDEYFSEKSESDFNKVRHALPCVPNTLKIEMGTPIDLHKLFDSNIRQAIFFSVCIVIGESAR